MESFYKRDQLERSNLFLEKVYGWKSRKNNGPKDQYGNFCSNLHRVSFRNDIEKFLREDVLDYVKRRDSRFSGVVHGVGSCFAGVSVSSNEADLLYMIEIEGDLEECKDLPGFAKYRLSDRQYEKWNDCTTSDGYLMSRQFATLFYKYVEEAFESDLKKHFTKQVAANFQNISLTGMGTIATTVTVTYKNATVDMDLVVAISCKGLPPIANASWLNGKSAWPNAESVSRIKASGFQLVSKAPYPLNEDEGSTLWRISFSLAETMLLQELDGNIKEYGLCTKKCFVLMKFYRMCYLTPNEKNVTPALKSYYLKVLLLSECYKYPDPSSWTSDKLAERFLSMYTELYTCIEKETMPDFFMPTVNIMKYPPYGITNHLKDLLDNPEGKLESWTKCTSQIYVTNMPAWEQVIKE